MKLLVTGGREWEDAELVDEALCLVLELTGLKSNELIVIEGGARGLDTIAHEVAAHLGCKVITMPAEWSRYGKGAGMIRNRRMLDKGPDLVLGFHSDFNNSKGTKDCVLQAHERSLPVAVIESSETDLKKILGALLESLGSPAEKK